MTRKLAIFEIIQGADKIASAEDRAAYLKQHDSEALRIILQCALDPRVRFALPPESPPYKPTAYLDAHGQLYNEATRLELFIEAMRPDIKKVKREMLFIGMLESVHPDDAKLLIAVKDKRLPKTITSQIVNLAFPGLVYEQIS